MVLAVGEAAASEAGVAEVARTNVPVDAVLAAADEIVFGRRFRPAVSGRFWMEIFAEVVVGAIGDLSVSDDRIRSGMIRFSWCQCRRARVQRYQTVSRNLSADREI